MEHLIIWAISVLSACASFVALMEAKKKGKEPEFKINKINKYQEN